MAYYGSTFAAAQGYHAPGSAMYPGQAPAGPQPGQYGYTAPPIQRPPVVPNPTYGAQPGYGAPPPQQGYGAPPPQQGYGAPPQPGYGAPPQPGYGAPPPQPGYGAPPQPGYGAPPPQPGYGAPPQQPGYGAPPARPPQPGYGAPPQQQPPVYETIPAQAPAPAPAPAPAAAPAPAQVVNPAAVAQGQVDGPPTKGTIFPHEPFDVEDDAQKLRDAMKGWGSDDKALLSLLTQRSADQRLKIAKMYKTCFGRDLRVDLKSETGGHLEDCLKSMMFDRPMFDAKCLRKAMKGLGTDEAALIEVIVPKTNAEILAINAAYSVLYPGRVLEKDIISETSSHYKRLLVSCLQGNRNENPVPDMALARKEAEQIYKAGEAKWGTDESVFNKILMLRSRPQLLATFKEYRKISQYDITRSIEHEMSGDLKRGMKAVVQCIKDRPTYFAERLYHAMKGMGTTDQMLIRIVLGRSEVDLEDIKDRFFDMYNKSLSRMISQDISGNYKRLILAIVEPGNAQAGKMGQGMKK